MADISWPSTLIGPAEFEWGLITPGSIFPIILTGQIRTSSLPGTLWLARITWGDLAPEQSVEVEALLMQMRGFTNRLLLHCLGRPALRGVGGGTPLAMGTAAAGATSITVDGLTPNITGIWAKSDLFSIVTSAASGTELKALTAAINSNGSGQATVNFEPPLRGNVADNAVIVVTKPTARFASMSAKASWVFKDVHVGSHSLQLVEDISS